MNFIIWTCVLILLNLNVSDLAKIGRCASNEVTVSLIKAKCLPILLYGTEACHFSVRETTSLEYPISCALMKVLIQNHRKFLKIVNWLSGSDRFHYLLPLGKDFSITNTQLLIMHFVRLLLPSRCQAIMWLTKR